jgi:hypothetical protein
VESDITGAQHLMASVAHIALLLGTASFVRLLSNLTVDFSARFAIDCDALSHATESPYGFTNRTF